MLKASRSPSTRSCWLALPAERRQSWGGHVQLSQGCSEAAVASTRTCLSCLFREREKQHFSLVLSVTPSWQASFADLMRARQVTVSSGTPSPLLSGWAEPMLFPFVYLGDGLGGRTLLFQWKIHPEVFFRHAQETNHLCLQSLFCTHSSHIF